MVKVLVSGKYRDKTEIMGTIIENMGEPISKTKMMYKAWLSYTQVKQYIEYMLKNGLIEKTNNDLYKKTNKADKFLSLVKDIQELIS